MARVSCPHSEPCHINPGLARWLRRVVAIDRGSRIGQKALLHSAAKSITSALVGLALEQGCLSSVDRKMIDFFPDFVDQIVDPRKKQITVRDMLQMRFGYPPEESDQALWEAVWSGDYVHLVADFPQRWPI